MRLRFLPILFLLVSFGLSAQDAEPIIKKIATVEGITEYQLDNGLQVLLFPDPSVPNITVNVTYKVGSRHEAYGETGMAHLLEHLVFKGTPDHPDIPDELTSHGARPNGTTNVDRTNYFETFAASDENLEWALDMEADRMVNSFIAKEDLDSEMSVVRNEFERGENSPSRILSQRVMSSAYLWHNYGKSTIGSKADLENVPIERLQAFYRKYYQPDNAVLIVAGKIDEEKTLELIKEKFGSIPRPERELYPTYTREPIQDGERFVELRRVGDVQQWMAIYHIPAGGHADFPAVALLVDAISDAPSGRLYQALVENGDASRFNGYARSMAEPGVAVFSASVLKENDLSTIEATFDSIMRALPENPVTEEELKRVKDVRLKNFELGMRNANRVGLALSSSIAIGDWRLGFITRDRIEQVTVDDVMRVAAKYLKPSNRTIGRFFPVETPDRAEIPEVRDLSMLTDDYKGREAIAEGEEFDPSYDNIDARTFTGTIGKTGLEYSLLPKETRGNSVIATMRLRFGNLDKLKGRADAGAMAGRLLMMGSEKYSRQEIQDRLDELKARVFIGGGATGAFVSIETENENLPAVIDFVGEILKTPTFPENEFDKMIKDGIARIEQQRSDPRSIASLEMRKRTSAYPKGHPFHVADFDESIATMKAMTVEDIKSFYKDFYGASDATFAASGDLDKEAVIAALERNFGDWKSSEKYERIARPYRAVKPESVKLETPDKANAIFYATQVMPISKDHPDYAALSMGNFMLGGGFLNSRLATRIRQEEGLSYSVGSRMNASDLDDRASFMAYAIYNPENREALEKAFKEEIEKVRNEGFTAEELEAAKSGWVQSQQMNRAQDRSLASTLANNAYLDRNMDWSKKLEAKMMSLTTEDINAAIKKYIDVDKMLTLRAGDFAKAEADAKKP